MLYIIKNGHGEFFAGYNKGAQNWTRDAAAACLWSDLHHAAETAATLTKWSATTTTVQQCPGLSLQPDALPGEPSVPQNLGELFAMFRGLNDQRERNEASNHADKMDVAREANQWATAISINMRRIADSLEHFNRNRGTGQ